MNNRIQKQHTEIKKYLVQLAGGVYLHVEMLEFHVDGERHHDQTRAEVDSSENDDEQSGDDLLTTSPEHPQNGGITDSAECTEH